MKPQAKLLVTILVFTAVVGLTTLAAPRVPALAGPVLSLALLISWIIGSLALNDIFSKALHDRDSPMHPLLQVLAVILLSVLYLCALGGILFAIAKAAGSLNP